MRLYKNKTHFYGKDLDQEAMLGYIVAENDEGAYGHINQTYFDEEWPESVEMDRDDIIAKKGDESSEYIGEFYDQKYGREDLGEISAEVIVRLKAHKILT